MEIDEQNYSKVVYPNIPHSPPVSSKSNDIAQIFRFFMFLPDVISVTIIM